MTKRKDFTEYGWNIAADYITFFDADGLEIITLRIIRLMALKTESWFSTEHFEEGKLLIKINLNKLANQYGKVPVEEIPTDELSEVRKITIM